MTLQLNAVSRDTKTKGDLSALRAVFKIPAVVYGHGTDNKHIALNYNEFAKLYREAGMSSVVDLVLDAASRPVKVLISDIQKDPISGAFIHVDLHQIRMDEKIKTEIKLNFINEAPAVKELGGNLIINKDMLNVECLPDKLQATIDVDISGLKQLNDSIHLRDMEIPEGITVLDDMDLSIVSVLAPRVEAEVETAPAEGEPALVGEEDKAKGEESEEKADQKNPSSKGSKPE